jgi:hypothetical protein
MRGPIKKVAGLSLNISPATRMIALAIRLIGHPASEQEIRKRCRYMRDMGLHNFDLSGPNIRNKIQRHWAGSTIFKTTHGSKNAAIFVRVPGKPVRWKLIEGFEPC